MHRGDGLGHLLDVERAGVRRQVAPQGQCELRLGEGEDEARGGQRRRAVVQRAGRNLAVEGGIQAQVVLRALRGGADLVGRARALE